MNIADVHPAESVPSGVVPLLDLALHHHPQDNVAIAKNPLQVGTILALEIEGHPPAQVTVHQPIPGGHKIALAEIGPGERMSGDMDFDAGRVLAGAKVERLATELLDLVVAVASGQPSKSEAQGIGEAEFSPWHIGATL